MTAGTVYMIPCPIAENTVMDVIPEQVKQTIKSLDFFLVENVRTARRFISSLKLGITIEDLQFELLDKKTEYADIQEYFKPVIAGKSVGIISEAGCPGVADPGAKAVAYAQQKGIKVVPLVGPSSILLALMASGFNGQQFKFHGYLPIDKTDRDKAILNIEQESKRLDQSQIFMDTPYRNNELMSAILKTCQGDTNLCVARDINGERELILTKAIKDWKSHKLELHKQPTIFILYRY